MSDALKERKEKLFYDHKNGYDRLTAADEAAMADYCQGYMAFLQQGKTERLCVAQAVALARAAG
ncbi:MAG: aminopeptidase, partial [Oscillospiraceae bacterium]|nr:aminopeptidase [Oscillospiraceae bacterium]